MEAWQAWLATVSALVAVTSTLYGMHERSKGAKAQREQFEEDKRQWLAEFEAQRQAQDEDKRRWRAEYEAQRHVQQVDLKKAFHLEQYRHRLSAYAPVMQALGAINDVVGAGDDLLTDGWESLGQVADAVHEQLYGEAGMLMTMSTRDQLHYARIACTAAAESLTEESRDRLFGAFYQARRYLRADLELVDNRSPERLDDLAAILGEESHARAAERAAGQGTLPG